MAAVPGLRRSELGDALRACRTALIGLGFISCMINLLYLTGSIFMLEVYDRVLPSRSILTLVGLIVLAGGLYMAQGVLDMIRSRILERIGTALDEALNKRVFDTIVRLPLLVGSRNEGLQPLPHQPDRGPRIPRRNQAGGRTNIARLAQTGSRHRRDRPTPPGCATFGGSFGDRGSSSVEINYMNQYIT